MRQNMNNRKERKIMRKSCILLVVMLLMALPMRSQVFLTQEDLDSERMGQWEDIGLIIPIHEQDFDQAEEYVPVGSGLAVLAMLGGAYLLGKKNKKN
jgi:hypothetical protein